MATQFLIVANVIIYVLVFYVLAKPGEPEWVRWGNNRYQVLNAGEYYRLFTAMFLHSEMIMHIVFNMYSLYIIGQTVERFYGHARFLVIYFLGGLTGSILSVLLNSPSIYSVGASGAVFAIFGAEMIFLYKHQKLLGRVAQLQLRQLVIIAAMNLFIGIASGLNSNPAGVKIDNWGHVGGLFGGLVLAWIIGPVFVRSAQPAQPEIVVMEDSNPLQKNLFHVLGYALGLIAAVYMGTLKVHGNF